MFENNQNTFLAAALHYALVNRFRVFPIETRGKRPLTKNGCLDATTDEAQIRRWWKEHPTANVGIATGKESNLAVVDVDRHKGAKIDDLIFGAIGKESFHTVKVQTGGVSELGRGFQFLYKFPENFDLRNSTSVLGKFIDIRGEGGYVVAPPSIHETGNQYELISDNDAEILPFPVQWIEKLQSVKSSNGVHGANGNGHHGEFYVAPPYEVQRLPERIAHGTQHDTLFRLGCSLRAKGLSGEAIEATLQTVNRQNCERPGTSEEIRKLAQSIATQYEAGDGSGWMPTAGKAAIEEIKTEVLKSGLSFVVSLAERGKYNVSAKDANGETIAKDVINLSEAEKRNKFIKQIESVQPLSDEEKTETARELIRLADASGKLVEADPAAKGETVETNFQILKDGRIIEQTYKGFAVYEPENGNYQIVESVKDADGTIYTPIDDQLFTKKGGIYLAEELTEYGTEGELIADIENYLSGYLDLKPLFLRLTALYILFTYISDSDSILELSYLNATGDAGSGKSRFGLAVCVASLRGLALITPSAASLYRIVDKFKPTLFLDEFNSNANSDDAAAIIQILNAGFQRTAQIPRQVATPDGKFKTEMFDPFCPKIIGSLKQSDSNAFNSRCIEIQMERTVRNDIPLRLSPKLLNNALALRNKLTLWRMRNIRVDFEAKLERAEAELRQTGIMPRSIQINIPLFALINDENLKREFIALLKGRDVVLIDEKQRTFDGELVKALHTILFDVSENGAAVWHPFDIKNQPTDGELCEHLRVEKITSMLNAERKAKDELQNNYVGKKLSSLGLMSKQILRRSSEYHKKTAIKFDAHRLKIIFKNYGLPVPLDFSLDHSDQSGKSSDFNHLTRSKEFSGMMPEKSPQTIVKTNQHNNNGDWSEWSKENSAIRAETNKEAKNGNADREIFEI